MTFSVVEFYGKHSNYSCGYCKQSDSCHSHGMWAHKLSCEDYQDLIDRGWRRSGSYCYKPIMDVTCCPSYTIKCDALNFRMNKSHKKIIKRVNKFLRDGKREPHESNEAENHEPSGDAWGHEHTEAPCKPVNRVDLESLPSMDNPNECSETNMVHADGLFTPKFPDSATSSKDMCDPSTSEMPKKAKLIRIARKREKLQKKGITGEELELLMQAGKGRNIEKSLEDFLAESPTGNEMSAHRLTIVTLPTSGKKFKETLDISYALYAKYQTMIHNDPPGSIADYLDFLVKSPLKGSTDFGSFHQQYWLDDRLVAVGVIDVLPLCVSSVYFFYDPEFKFLSLGTYGSLRELAFTRARHRVNPSIRSYYMGFYIHSCQKMRYKSNLQPSYLLCPEAYTWHKLDNIVLHKLDQRKYTRLNVDKTVHDAQRPSEQDVKDVLLLVGRSYLRYSEYLLGAQEVPDVSEYAQLVGKVCAKRMMLYGM
uniref:Arginyl-tRNA--protein transferase 1 n=1 Tax=Anopheles atroparvus TaxID=41427 RepID=A0AAG5D1N0_ANOAO